MTLKIIGTSHIAQQSVDEIKKAVKEEQPEIIALELDLQRASALMSEQKNKVKFSDIMRIGIKGYLFVKVGQYVQQKLGKMVGVAPGSEMKTALELARREKLQIALIDQPIQITLKRFSKSLTWREKFHFISDFFKGIFFRKKQMKELGLENFDLTKVPAEKMIEKMMLQTKQRYPSIYKTLVTDRNQYMVRKLVKLLRAHPDKKILAIVGAGHKKGMEKLLLKVDVVR
ncbi:MAG: TraB/GumN family protein [Nanoarchaeota archaeon]|nr:TraB/GumN family protein [Nanoarchaeota archaeon]MBU1622617.1 TraB/GumN family protein [Nanoarchaeota archaeon]